MLAVCCFLFRDVFRRLFGQPSEQDACLKVCILKSNVFKAKWSRDGAVVRALASHQCGPGSIPSLGVICGLNLLLVLVPAPRVFLRVLRFSSLHKNQHFQIPIRPGNSGEKSHSVDSTEIPIYFLFIYSYFIYHYVHLKTT